MYPNTLTLEGEIPKAQIKMWIHYHRTKLISENINKGILSYDNISQNIRTCILNGIGSCDYDIKIEPELIY